MIARVLIRPDSYHDSVSLMAISRELLALPGVENAVVAMGTPMNKELLAGVGLLTPKADDATAADLVIAVGAATEAEAEAALARAGEMLVERRVSGEMAAAAPRTIAEAVQAEPDSSLALISVPGAYAAREARLALEQGLDVMLYSDNVSLEDEVALKRLAVEKGRLLMGPDCGTAIIDGVGLGFANVLRRGPIGVVAASGTGAQELTCLIDRLGSGVSSVIGTGGRDGSEAVGGLMLLEGLKRLETDPDTEVIVVITKPPAPSVADRVREAARDGSKPVLFCFLDRCIDEAAARAVSLVTGEPADALLNRLGYGAGLPKLRVSAGRPHILGLFSGGTLCSQAKRILDGTGAALIDLGDDQYTVGRPHPMIDPTLRVQKLREAAADPTIAFILVDVVLGHGAHPDPAGALAPAIREAVDAGIAVVASVTGTEADPQRLSFQEATLREAGVTVLPTACLAASTVRMWLGGRV